MSAAVRAALAAKRAEHRSRSTSPSKPNTNGDTDQQNLRPHFGRDLDASIASPFGSPKPAKRSFAAAAAADRSTSSPTPEVDLNQKTEEEIVKLSIQNGKVNLSSRSPSLQEVPAMLLSLLADEPQPWFLQIPEDDRQPWYMREELHTLQLSNNEIQSLPDKLAEFRGLKRLELHSNRLSTLPSAFFQLSALTTLNLSKNGLTTFPPCLLALDNLVMLDLSHNKISTLWKDADVISARAQREAWDKENAVQENGVWAGLSPSKKDRKVLDAVETQRDLPMRALRSLDLSYNKLNNAALGIPDLARRRTKPTDVTNNETVLVRLPAGLKTLNLGYNSIRGPVSVALFQQLHSLHDLGLQGCGIGDDVFASTESTEALSSLSVLDLSGCELDDLARVEGLFGSSRILSFDQAMGNTDSPRTTQDKPEPTQGMPARQLVRVLNRPTPADIDKMEDRCNAKILCLLLEGNPLREEALRQKRGGRSAASPEKKAVPTPVTTVISPDAKIATSIATPPASAPSTTSASAATGSSQLPAKPQVVKEDWEILAESGLNTALGRRKLQVEQARKEQEAAAAAATSAAASSAKAVDEDAQTRGRKPRASPSDEANTAIAADPESAGSAERSTSNDADEDPGSALSTAKLSTKKKEALGQVPCKFFRSNGCSAGASCPFAHTLPGDGGQKSVCQWFLKGNCRFGHKCALAHVLPGQPMSMDRKNKRAAQHGQPLPPAPAPGGSQQGQQVGLSKRQVSGQQHGTPTRSNQQLPAQSHNRNASFTTRDHDLPFGLPDDMQPPAPTVADLGRAGFEGINAAQDQSMMSASFAGSTSFRRPSTLSQSLSASLAAQSFGGMDSAAAAFGTSASASRAFGTSPFSHPGGHSLFFSGSQDSEGGAGPFARSQRDGFAPRMNDEAAKAWAASGGRKEVEEIEDAEDFLPSSLSDLLTPAELERRKRSNRLSSSFAGNDERITIAQSMPSQVYGSSLGFGRSAIGAERGKSSGLSNAFQQQQAAGKEEYRPFGDGRRTSGLDSIAFRDSPSPAAHHAPGQSLPQGLAAGLSRLHLRTGASGNLASGGFGSIGASTHDSLAPTTSAGGAFGSGSFSQSSQLNGLRVPSSLDDYGLGPTAPSSVLPHRSPLTFAANSGSRLSGSFVERNYLNHGSPGSSSAAFSPQVSAIGSHRNNSAGMGGDGGIAIPEGGAAKNVSVGGGMGRYAQHPATQRLRAGSSAAAPHSPLTLPVVTAEEDEEEAIFELE